MKKLSFKMELYNDPIVFIKDEENILENDSIVEVKSTKENAKLFMEGYILKYEIAHNFANFCCGKNIIDNTTDENIDYFLDIISDSIMTQSYIPVEFEGDVHIMHSDVDCDYTYSIDDKCLTVHYCGLDTFFISATMEFDIIINSSKYKEELIVNTVKKCLRVGSKNGTFLYFNPGHPDHLKESGLSGYICELISEKDITWDDLPPVNLSNVFFMGGKPL